MRVRRNYAEWKTGSANKYLVTCHGSVKVELEGEVGDGDAEDPAAKSALQQQQQVSRRGSLESATADATATTTAAAAADMV